MSPREYLKEVPDPEAAAKKEVREKKPVFKVPKSPAELAMAAAKKAARRNSAGSRDSLGGKGPRRSSSEFGAPLPKRRPSSNKPPKINQLALAQVGCPSVTASRKAALWMWLFLLRSASFSSSGCPFPSTLPPALCLPSHMPFPVALRSAPVLGGSETNPKSGRHQPHCGGRSGWL